MRIGVGNENDNGLGVRKDTLGCKSRGGLTHEIYLIRNKVYIQ